MYPRHFSYIPIDRRKLTLSKLHYWEEEMGTFFFGDERKKRDELHVCYFVNSGDGR